MDIAGRLAITMETPVSTIYLFDALFLLVAGMAALFVFGLATSRFTRAFKILFLLFIALFLFTLLFGYFTQPSQRPDPEQASMDREER